MKLWRLIVWNWRFRKYFFSCAYIKLKYYWVFCVDQKKKNSGVYIKEKYYWVFCVNTIFFFECSTRMLEITIDNCYLVVKQLI